MSFYHYGADHQECLAHVLRYLQDAVENEPDLTWHKKMKEFLSGMNYRVIDAEENAKLTMKYGVMQAPTLVVLKGDNVEKYTNASNIRRFVNESR